MRGGIVPTTRSKIRTWLKKGIEKGATHVIIVCDTYDHGDFPVFVMPGEDAKQRADQERKKSMQKVMEVYNLSLDLESQLAEHRAFHY
jgi:hypothetical protein